VTPHLHGIEAGSSLKDHLTITANADELRVFCARVLKRFGVPSDDAEIASDILIESDLRGIDSHGIAHLSRYVYDFQHGVACPQPNIEIVEKSPVTAVVDGGGGFGPVVAYKAMELAISKAKNNYLGFVAVRNSNHYGIAGYYTMMAVKHDMIGIATTNAKPNVLPTFGRSGVLGTNPISIAVPTDRERPFVLDMATSAVAFGKLEMSRRSEKPIPLGWATDETGQPTNDASLVFRNLDKQKGGGLLPLGGAGEEFGGHKGYGLALAVEIFSSLLSGAAPSFRTYPKDSGGNPLPADIGHFFGVIRIDGFRSITEFKIGMDDLIHHIRNSSKLEGTDRIYIHGEKESEMTERRKREGIPVPSEVATDLRKIAKKLAIALPF
jgi:LDH2 family malate/lactate/ureidoglycolate dehydrogenase